MSLSKNEEEVLWGLVAHPELADAELAELLDMPYSTFSTIRKRLKERDYFSTIQVPMMQNLGAEVMAVLYTFFNPAISVQQRAGITTRTIEIFEEIFYSVGETHKGFSISFSGNYTAIGQITERRIETFAKEGLLDQQQPREVIFPFEISQIPLFFDFDALLADAFDIDLEMETKRGLEPGTSDVELSNTEKIILHAMVENPDATDLMLADIVNMSRHTISKARKKLEEAVLIAKKRIPNLEKLGFNVLTFSHINFNPSKPLDDELLESGILNNPSSIFLAARSFECVLLSVYKDYEAYREDNGMRLQYLKENDYLADLPAAGKYMIPNMVVMKDMVFGPIVKKTLML
ncbi:MAG: Lrp/AsnC family transcriptional regulator [Thermoplasmata archaeon]|nr:Lrp/AsnC family transcriptional regulator [Thermoplasmata archaeon]